MRHNTKAARTKKSHRGSSALGMLTARNIVTTGSELNNDQMLSKSVRQLNQLHLHDKIWATTPPNACPMLKYFLFGEPRVGRKDARMGCRTHMKVVIVPNTACGNSSVDHPSTSIKIIMNAVSVRLQVNIMQVRCH